MAAGLLVSDEVEVSNELLDTCLTIEVLQVVVFTSVVYQHHVLNLCVWDGEECAGGVRYIWRWCEVCGRVVCGVWRRMRV